MKNVLEFHSGVQFDQQEDDASSPEAVPLTRSVETWDVPVIVTTAVQFFESLYACQPSKCRKLHNLAQSVLIFDEAQMLPLPYLRPCVWAIAQLVRHYGASAVLCTATQPALDPIFQEFAPEIPIREICPMAEAHWESFRRVSFQQGRNAVLDGPGRPPAAAGAGSVRRQHPPGRAGGLPPTVRSRQFPSLHPDVPRAPQENSG